MAWNAKYFTLAESIGPGAAQVWEYRDTVAAATLDTSGYLATAADLGARIGDRVIYSQVDDQDTPTTVTAVSTHIVNAVNSDGSVDVTDATAFSMTDTD